MFAAGTSEAAASTLTVSQARALAKKIVAKQRKQRSLVFTQLGDPVRKSSSRIDFPYRDRSTSNVLCTARIVVVGNSSSRRADLKDSSCHGIPSDVLAFERASRALAHSVSGDLGKKVYCASPGGFSSELNKVASAFLGLKREWFDDCYR